ncbi:amylo-alpha-1,6-glucosidase [Thalassobacillus pellis]|uniref:amylo-alpha-1,6-glucosidase n=1 Tax=Thalassobacillus pellis TaxID=748008 RepID=UPI00195FADE6|nr:trehalase family glycosidase [Thalassobacillus pellis]MBM7553450.1 glycogen debranching enzyme [Thalassobacillus pellis]
MDITTTPMSHFGSYLALTYQESDTHEKKGLYINSVRGKSRQHQNALKIIPVKNGEPVEYSYQANEFQISIQFDGGELHVCFEDESRIFVKGSGNQVGLVLDTQPIFNFEYNYLLGKEGEEYCLVNSYKNLTKYLIFAPDGSVSLKQNVFMDTVGSTNKADNSSSIHIGPEDGSHEFLCVVEDVPTHGSIPEEREYSFEKALDKSTSHFLDFLSRQPSVPEEYQETLREAVYLNWTCIVNEEGLLKRKAMFMSNSNFPGVWSWDNAFNALALAGVDDKLAWDQIQLLFDYQDDKGQIPGSISDSTIRWNFSKPPVQGYFVLKMMEKMTLTTTQLEKVYTQIKGHVEFYFRYKDSNQDGIPEYHHGNDSGQDNSTVFRNAAIIDSPDLTAFLIKSMDMLAVVAGKLDRQQEEKYWEGQAEELTERFCQHFLVDDIPAARFTKDGSVIESQGILPLVSIILAKKLPESVREKIIRVLKDKNYLTQWGIASEALDSPYYEQDAYWRGPIWAPTTLLFVEAFEECGEHELASEVRQKFLELCKQNGFAENFHAETGEGLRDLAHTWTSSVFIHLAAQEKVTNAEQKRKHLVHPNA